MNFTAKLFMHGGSQAVRLPKEFRFEGAEVRISKVREKVILEPLKKQPTDFDKFWAELDALGARDFLPGAFRTTPWPPLINLPATSPRRPLLTLSTSTGITELHEP